MLYLVLRNYCDLTLFGVPWVQNSGLKVYGRYRKKFMTWHDKRKNDSYRSKYSSRWLLFQAEIDTQEESLNNYENCPFEVKCPTNGVYEIRLFVASKCLVYNNRSLPCILVQIVYFKYKNVYFNICLPAYIHTEVKLLPL